MSNVFNIFGNLPINSPLRELKKTINDTVKDFIDQAVEMGADIAELRALESCLTSEISITFAEDRLTRQIAQKNSKD